VKPIKKISMIDEVVANLKELIFSGELVVGDKLMAEKDICNQLNVGRSTAREALRVLQAMGYVEIRHGMGAFVKRTAPDNENILYNWFSENEVEITDCMEVRMALETLAIKLVFKRATDEELTQLQKKLEKNVDNFKKAALNEEIVLLVDGDKEFHQAIVLATHNPLLISIYEKVIEAFREYRVKVLSIKNKVKGTIEPHQKIIHAISKRNVESTVEEMTKHLTTSLDDMIKADGGKV
jgi:GntR family transcriptional repressor for pyruvate dehydrogenase complex